MMNFEMMIIGHEYDEFRNDGYWTRVWWISKWWLLDTSMMNFEMMVIGHKYDEFWNDDFVLFSVEHDSAYNDDNNNNN